jgi:hypothetical protein
MLDLHATVLEGLRARAEEPHSGSGGAPHLWPSEIGGCPRAALQRVRGFPRDARAVSGTLLEAGHLGTWMEEATYDALHRVWPLGVARQVVLRSSVWSGKIDFLLTRNGYPPTIIEHKIVANPQYWNYHGNLPKREHVFQALLYGALYEETYHARPLVLLYYTTWGHSATFGLEADGGRVRVEAILDDAACAPRALLLDFARVRQEFEGAFAAPDIPPRRACSDGSGCTFRGAPSCAYFGACWDSAPEGCEGK